MTNLSPAIAAQLATVERDALPLPVVMLLDEADRLESEGNDTAIDFELAGYALMVALCGEREKSSYD